MKHAERKLVPYYVRTFRRPLLLFLRRYTSAAFASARRASSSRIALSLASVASSFAATSARSRTPPPPVLRARATRWGTSQSGRREKTRGGARASGSSGRAFRLCPATVISRELGGGERHCPPGRARRASVRRASPSGLAASGASADAPPARRARRPRPGRPWRARRINPIGTARRSRPRGAGGGGHRDLQTDRSRR